MENRACEWRGVEQAEKLSEWSRTVSGHARENDGVGAERGEGHHGASMEQSED